VFLLSFPLGLSGTLPVISYRCFVCDHIRTVQLCVHYRY